MYSHIPTLETLMALGSIKTALEFGSGLSSTGIFLSGGVQLTSIEMCEQREWYDKVKKEFSNYESFNYVYLPGADAFKNWNGYADRYDLVFVDGHGSSRHAQINFALDKTNLIIAHDTQNKDYEWNRVVLPDNWIWIDLKWNPEWTSIIRKVQ